MRICKADKDLIRVGELRDLIMRRSIREFINNEDLSKQLHDGIVWLRTMAKCNIVLQGFLEVGERRLIEIENLKKSPDKVRIKNDERRRRQEYGWEAK